MGRRSWKRINGHFGLPGGGPLRPEQGQNAGAKPPISPANVGQPKPPAAQQLPKIKIIGNRPELMQARVGSMQFGIKLLPDGNIDPTKLPKEVSHMASEINNTLQATRRAAAMKGLQSDPVYNQGNELRYDQYPRRPPREWEFVREGSRQYSRPSFFGGEQNVRIGNVTWIHKATGVEKTFDFGDEVVLEEPKPVEPPRAPESEKTGAGGGRPGMNVIKSLLGQEPQKPWKHPGIEHYGIKVVRRAEANPNAFVVEVQGKTFLVSTVGGKMMDKQSIGRFTRLQEWQFNYAAEAIEAAIQNYQLKNTITAQTGEKSPKIQAGEKKPRELVTQPTEEKNKQPEKSVENIVLAADVVRPPRGKPELRVWDNLGKQIYPTIEGGNVKLKDRELSEEDKQLILKTWEDYNKTHGTNR